jgi:hypothetical protein
MTQTNVDFNLGRDFLSSILNISNQQNTDSADPLMVVDSPMAMKSAKSPFKHAEAHSSSSEVVRPLASLGIASETKTKKRTRPPLKGDAPADGVSLRTETDNEEVLQKVSRFYESDKENLPEDKDLGEVVMVEF